MKKRTIPPAAMAIFAPTPAIDEWEATRHVQPDDVRAERRARAGGAKALSVYIARTLKIGSTGTGALRIVGGRKLRVKVHVEPTVITFTVIDFNATRRHTITSAWPIESEPALINAIDTTRTHLETLGWYGSKKETK